MRRFVLLMAVGVTLVVGGGWAAPAGAHPLGNFTVNTYSGLRVGDGDISIDFLVDMAEIPTLQNQDDVDSVGEVAYARQSCESFAGRLDVRVDGQELTLAVGSSDLAYRPGQAGLRTLRLSCSVTGANGSLGGGEHRVSFASTNFTDRAGWREVTAVGDGATVVASDVPTASVSDRLVRYPEDLLASPLDQRSADLLVKRGGVSLAPVSGGPAAPEARVSPLPRGVDGATRAFTSFVGRQDLTVGFALLAFGASVVLGAIHAFAPGHGKTVMAAYLVGQRGSFRQAMAVALTVTATHTAGVLALGIAISTSAVVAPERVYPWLGAASGILLALLGLAFLRRIITRSRRPRDHQAHADHARAAHDYAAHAHAHADHAHAGHDHDHADHGDHDHADHGHAPHDHADERPSPGLVHSHGGRSHSHGPVGGDPLVTRRGLLAMGFVGGLLPSPSAVVVLLGAVALGRTWFGVLLVVAYGLGMAAALAATGLVLLHARAAVDRRLTGLRSSRLLQATTRLLPPATAVFIVTIGLYLTARAAAQI